MGSAYGVGSFATLLGCLRSCRAGGTGVLPSPSQLAAGASPPNGGQRGAGARNGGPGGAPATRRGRPGDPGRRVASVRRQRATMRDGKRGRAAASAAAGGGP